MTKGTKVTKNGITYKGKTYPLVFNINTMEVIQEEYGTVDKWGDLTDQSKGEVNAKALKFGITAMLNEGIEIYNEDHEDKREYFAVRQVGRIISDLGEAHIAKKMNEAVIEASKSDEKNA